MIADWFTENAVEVPYFEKASQLPELAFWMHTTKDIAEFNDGDIPVELKRLILILGYACSYGDLCIELSAPKIADVESRLRNLLESSMPGLVDIVKFVEARIHKAALPDVISRGPETPLVLVQENAKTFLYFQKHFLSRRALIQNLEQLAKVPPESWNIDQAIAAFKSGVKDRFALAAEQKRAIALALYSSLTIVTGGPGTGKTTVIVGILRSLVELGIPPADIRVVTPTGRAARRARQAIEAADSKTLNDIETSTLHSLLGFSRNRMDFKYSRASPIPFQVIVLDEVSMVDLAMMSRLLECIRPGVTRLVLLGDRDQLPSVESGAVLGDLVELLMPENQSPGYSRGFQDFWKATGQPALEASADSKVAGLIDSIVELKASHRSGEDIRVAAQAINQGQMPRWIVQPDPVLQGAGLVEINDAAGLSVALRTWASRFFNSAHLSNLEKAQSLGAESVEARELGASILSHVASHRILTFIRHGDRGTMHINAVLKQHAYDHGVLFENDIHAGLPLMVIQNDYRRRIYNGETGVLVKFSNGFRWIFSEAERVGFLSPAALPLAEAAHAITVHKSQGSEYENVLIVMPEEADHPILSRQILYTGLTRAKKSVTVVGSNDVIKTALARKIRRETGGLRIDPVA
ncbi:MAG: exodeoxyribonuclease V subunit alpha [Leptospirales bacterium]|nr:exodeoxyribonuclease V subunit alpha [Leptospirales bacterium]